MPQTEQIDAEPASKTAAAPRSIAYLVSRYPTLSMVFVLREVRALRRLGFHIETASINPPDRPAEELTAEEREEAATTYCVKCDGLSGALAAHIIALATHFGGYGRGLALAFGLAGLDLARLALNLAYFTEGLMVGRWMRRNRQTHLHVHLASQAASVGLFTRQVFGVGYSLSVHGPDEFFDAEGQYLAQKIQAANFLVCISDFTRSQLMRLAPVEAWSKFSVVRLGVDVDVFSPDLRFTALLPGPAPRSDTLRILCVGRLTPAKGQHILIEAVGLLQKQGRAVFLTLVGGGPDDSSLRALAARVLAEQSIFFAGPVNQDRIPVSYATADVFCLPSLAEGLPVVLMEAMAFGLATVSTYISGIPELIRNEQDGLLVPASNAEALAAALARLIDDPAVRARLAMSGRERVVELYDLNRNVQLLAQIFRDRLVG